MLILRWAAIAVGVFGAVELIPKLADALCKGGAVWGGGGVPLSAARETRTFPFEAASFR